MRAAFFDLDRTLLDVNSGLHWAFAEHRAGHIRTSQLLRATLWSALYHLSLVDIERMYAEATSHYLGTRREVLEQRTHAWFAREMGHRLRPGARPVLAAHRAQGERLVLLTNSSCFEASMAARSFEMDDWIANHFPLDAEGRLRGTFERPLCYGHGKVQRAEQWAAHHGVALAESSFYTDSYSDLPMLERVAHPFVVAPDPRLRRVARQRGWPILQW
jgi:HAD superfamily hydrolase (TIGR01490 family)